MEGVGADGGSTNESPARTVQTLAPWHPGTLAPWHPGTLAPSHPGTLTPSHPDMNLLPDLRYGLRLLRRSPVFAAVTIGTLALGIGATTAIYSIVESVVLRPLPYRDPDRVVMLWEDASFVSFPRNTPAPANYFSWKEMNRSFADVAATRGATANLTAGGPPEQVVGRRVTSNFFAVLGVEPVIGRTF